jgi:hypothetical protein
LLFNSDSEDEFMSDDCDVESTRDLPEYTDSKSARTKKKKK